MVATGGFREGKWELAGRCKVTVTEMGKFYHLPADNT